MDALNGLKKLDSESIDCVMTSPPYWALRDYGAGTERVWDGDDGCEHRWEIEKGIRSSWGNKDTLTDKKQGTNRGAEDNVSALEKESNFCSKCGAWKGQLGLEPTFDLYIKHLCDIFDEVKRVLKKTGTCWVNLGDSYNSNHEVGTTDGKKGWKHGAISTDYQGRGGDSSLPTKCLCQIPSRFSIEMTNRGWILRNEIIWYKPNCMPSSVKDRFTVDFEKIFFFTKNKKYWFEQQFDKNQDCSIERGNYGYVGNAETGYPNGKQFSEKNTLAAQNLNPLGRNKRTVWKICPKPFPGSHFAVFPEELCETPIKSGCPEFICKKCGVVREKVYEEGELISSCDYLPMVKKPRSEPQNRMIKGDLPKDPYGALPKRDKKFIGYSDCKCNAGFQGGIVLDPFGGRGTVGRVAKEQGKNYIILDISQKFCDMAKDYIKFGDSYGKVINTRKVHKQLKTWTEE